MPRIVVYILASFALLTLNSAEARVSWIGRAVISAAPGTVCSTNGHSVGQVFDAAFFPSGLSNNGTQTFLTFFSNTTAFSIHTNGRPAANKAYGALHIRAAGDYDDNLIGKITAFNAPVW